MAERRIRWGDLRVRITAIAVAVVCGVLVIAGWLLVSAQQRTLTNNLRDALEQRSDDVVELLRAGREPGDATVAGGDDVLIQLATDDGELYSSAPSSPIRTNVRASALVPSWATITLDKSRYMVATRPVATIHGTGVLRVAGLTDDLHEARAVLIRGLEFGIPIVALLLGWLIHTLVGRTLQPVETIRREADEIDGSRLDRRVATPAGNDEISRLASTMNRMLDRLDDSAQLQKRFVADASHELRGPLARMRAGLEVDIPRARQLGMVESHQAVLDDAIELERLVDELLELARLDDGGGLVRRVAVDLDDIVLGETTRLRSDAGPRFDLRSVSSAQVVGDPAQLVRAIRNLLDNASRFAASRVTVSLGEIGERAVLSIDDDGPGIPAADRQRVFERFTKLDDARTAGRGGTGLGLAITREIIVAHGGSISIDGAPGEGGTRMVVSLPTSVG